MASLRDRIPPKYRRGRSQVKARWTGLVALALPRRGRAPGRGSAARGARPLGRRAKRPAGWARRPVAARARCAIPELPEVETVRRQLEPWLTGRTVARAELLAPPGPKYAGLERAAGQRIEAVGRRGKFLLLPLSGGDELVAHLESLTAPGDGDATATSGDGTGA